MKLELRDYQQDALARVEAAEERGVRRQLGVAATGLGKTVMFCALAERRGGRALVLVHRDELVRQAAAKMREVWPDARVGIVKASENDVRADVVVASVQTLARPKRLAELMAPFSVDGGTLLGRAAPFGLVVVDEAHHAAAESYRGIIDALRAGSDACACGCPRDEHVGELINSGRMTLDSCGDADCCAGYQPGPLLLGVTATPDRGDGKGLDDLFDEITFNYDILWGIRAGYLADMRGLRIEVSTLDMSEVKVRRGDYDQGQAGRAMEEAGAERYVVAAWLEHALGRRTLVFTPTVDVARLVAAEFASAGVSAAYVHGGTPLEERRQVLADYSAGRIDVIANCAVLTEGYDEPRTDCIIVARPTKSRALYCFDSETEVLTPSGWVKGRRVPEGHPIAAFDPETGAVRWEPVLATVERPLLPGEQMMALRSPSIDVRVTDTHRMVWRRRQGRSRERGPWEVTTAGELAQRSDVWELPVAGQAEAPGVPLTDAELAFIGWVQTDGCVNSANGAVQISQQRPEQRAHIEATLTACGFKWRVSETSEPTAFGPRKHPLAVYRVSKGKPRGEDAHLRGWGDLEPWLPKADHDAFLRLEAMTADQWAVFLDAWHRGDGSKQEGQTWTRRSYHLAIANEWIAGWVQAMCMRRGWRANVARQADLWIVHCRKGDARYVGGATSTDRPRLVPTPELPGELVWCVSVASGAILTRRNGKGAIVGQTQMVGRGTRRHPDKGDCLVLDIVGASADLSLVTIPSLFGLEQKYADRVGGEGVAAICQERDDEAVRLGRMRAEEADLFRTMRQTGTLAWVAVHRDGAPRRYQLNLGKDQPSVVLAQLDGDSWGVGLQAPDGGGFRRLMVDVPMEMAQGVGEDYVRKAAPDALRLVDQDAAWRRRKPSTKQVAAAKKWRLPNVDQYATAGDLSDALNVHIARRKSGPRKGASK